MRNLFFTLAFSFIGTFALAQSSCACGSGSGTVTANCTGDCYCNSTDGGCSCGCKPNEPAKLLHAFNDLGQQKHNMANEYRVTNCGIMTPNFVKGVKSIVMKETAVKEDERVEQASNFLNNYLNI